MQDQTNHNSAAQINIAPHEAIKLPKELSLNSSFWQFSLSIWKHAEAQASLLLLQDEYSLKVNRLLFCCWLGFERREILVDELATNTVLTQWSDQTVAPLRQIRKQLKYSASHHPQLRETVQNAELQAEQIEQALMFQAFEKLSSPTTKRNTLQTLSYNLLSYTNQALGLVQENQTQASAALKPHLVTLIQAAIPNHDRKHIEAHFPSVHVSTKQPDK